MEAAAGGDAEERQPRELYALLHLDPKASDEDVKRAYRQWAQVYHPDEHQTVQMQDIATENFQRIRDAYEVLSDERKRQVYDLYGMEGLTSGLELGDGDGSAGALPPKPQFRPLSAHEVGGGKFQYRKVVVPPHRYTPLKAHWMEIYTPVYDQMKIDIRMNLKRRIVELKTRRDTPDAGALQKSADFVHAYILGFDIQDAVALLRLDDLYVESFEIKDVKTLRGEHLSRAIGRLSGKGGKTKFAIENSTRTRIVIADTRLHILGSFANIRTARDALCNLIMGSPAGKVYSKLRAVANRLAEQY